MTTLRALEIADAIVAQIKAAIPGMSFAPVIVQVGDLSHYPENPALSEDIPGVFVQPISMDPYSQAGIGGEDFDEEITFRIVLVDRWTTDPADPGYTALDQNPVRKKVSRTQELVDKVAIRSSGANWQLGDGVAGVTIFPSPPGGIEFAPPEHAMVSEQTQNETRRLYATAFTWVVTARTAR